MTYTWVPPTIEEDRFLPDRNQELHDRLMSKRLYGPEDRGGGKWTFPLRVCAILQKPVVEVVGKGHDVGRKQVFLRETDRDVFSLFWSTQLRRGKGYHQGIMRRLSSFGDLSDDDIQYEGVLPPANLVCTVNGGELSIPEHLGGWLEVIRRRKRHPLTNMPDGESEEALTGRTNLVVPHLRDMLFSQRIEE